MSISQLRADLFIGTASNARRLDADHRFDRVITLGYYDGFGYEKPETSTDEHVFRDGEHDYQDFEAAVEVVLAALQSSEVDRVFVHCQAGASRSVAVCGAVLAVRDNCSLDEAFCEIRSKHPPANPQPEVTASAERFVANRA